MSSGVSACSGPDPEISVIVPHYHDLASLDRCLDRLVAQTMPGARFEIVVADNDSPEGAAAVGELIGQRARLVIAHERGAGPARNAGVAASRGRILAFTDCDCLPESQWLEAGVAALDRFDLVGGAVEVLVEHGEPLSGAEAFERVFAFDNRSYVLKKGFTVTANLFCSRAVFDAIGPFRVGVSEDADWCWRARAQGYRIGYAEQARVAHPARRDWPALLRKWQRLNLETYALMAAAPGGRVRWVLRSLALPLSILAHAPRIATSPALDNGAARARAFATLARLRLWRCVDALRLAARPRPEQL